MALPLRQSTASQEILLGPFVDDADGDTQMTALAIANTDIKIWKHGATTLADKNSGGATHIANGRYYATLDATDTDTIGMLEVMVHVADALPIRREYIVYDEAVYDVLFGTTAPSTLTAANVNSEVDTALADIHLDHLVATAASIPAVTAGTYLDQIMDDGTAVYDRTTDSLQAVRDRGDSAWAAEAGHTAADVWAVSDRELTSGGVTAIVTAVLDELLSGHVTAGSLAQAISDILEDTGTTLDGKLDTIDTNVDAILADTGTDGVVVSASAIRTAVGLASANLDTQLGALPTAAENATEVWTTVLTEAYAAHEAEGTGAELLYGILQMLTEFAISSTSYTVKKLDGATTAFTITLNDASTPTAAARTA